jgi:ferredoxin-NADP reductase
MFRVAPSRATNPLRRAAASLTTPLLPDDFLTLVNPLWSSSRPCGRIVAIQRRTERATSLRIRPGRGWPGTQRAGQYVRVGVDVDGVRHWRTYSLTSPEHPLDGCIELTVQAVPDGLVSTRLARSSQVGDVIGLAPAEGEFTLPRPTPERLLMITAGSGITPVMAILRTLAATGPLPDTVLLHSAPTSADAIFREELLALARRHPTLRLRLRQTSVEGRLELTELARICPDWADREAFVCGPAGLLDAAEQHWRAHPDRLRLERFSAPQRSPGGAGGTVRFGTGPEVAVDGRASLLEAGEAGGALLPSGCRMGICFGCALPLREGQVRDLRTGRVHGEPGDLIQTCISGASGAAHLDLPPNQGSCS